MSENDLVAVRSSRPSSVSGTQRQITPIASHRAHYIDECLVMAEIGNTCVAIWRTPPNEFLFDRQVTAFRSVIENHAKKVGFMGVIEACAAPPNDMMRRATVRMFDEHRQHIACVCGVIQGKGFRAAITRSVMSGMALLFGSHEFPAKMTESITVAAQWASQYTDIGAINAFIDTVESYRILPKRF